MGGGIKMESIYITHIEIESLRHLKNINIKLSNDTKKHLIITGKNGCGKTSLLEAVSTYVNSIVTNKNFNNYPVYLKNNIDWLIKEKDPQKINNYEEGIKLYERKIKETRQGLNIDFNLQPALIYKSFQNGQFVLAYYNANRMFKAEEVKNIEKISFNDHYSIGEKPSFQFVKYLADLKVTQALALAKNNMEKAHQIEQWFDSFEQLLKNIFEDETLSLVFDEDTFKFSIAMANRELFDFNSLSSGYAAVLDIVVDIIMRMEKYANKKFEYNMPGIVLIDEIETHLHLAMQKNVMAMLTTLFPNIQFIVSTHSPFILNSIDDVVIYDLENHTLVENGLTDIPYKGIVEGYFEVDSLSKELKEKFEKYKQLVQKEHLEIEDFAEIARLQMYLEEIPDYLALDISTEYQALKLEFERRSDLYDKS